jgi:hypothetical protein
LADFKFPFREQLVTPPSGQESGAGESEEEKTARALEAFRKDAKQVLERRQELGPWELRVDGDQFPYLYRNLIDAQGHDVELQISPTIDYPQDPPSAKANPRIGMLAFQPTGFYEGNVIVHWTELVEQGMPLVELCEELRRFESPEQTFARHAREAARRRPGWEHSAGDSARLTRLTFHPVGTSPPIVLSYHDSYPLWPPEIEGLRELELRSNNRGRLTGAVLATWRAGLEVGGNPLERFLAWLETQLFTVLGPT